MNRLRLVKGILWFVLGGAAVVTVSRFAFGLGASTALTDLTPWGLWIGFDVMGGVALAAGGFVTAAIAHVFHREQARPLVRAAVLTALLGYIAVPVGLLYDLGLPWNIWHMIFWWNPHSPLFEVGMCVMLYLAVLVSEFLPVILEPAKHPLLMKIHRLFSRFALVFIILGIMLSTLHQSSLGSLFLNQPHRLHPLWYSPVLPVLFFVSAVALGLMMVTAESLFTSWLYERKPHTSALQLFAKVAIPVLGIYLALRVGDLALRGQLRHLGVGGFERGLFVVELLISTVTPLVLLSIPAVRRRASGLFAAAALCVAGMALNRVDVGGVAMVSTIGTSYLPSWMELLTSAGIVSAAVLAFFFLVERFRVWEEPAVDRQRWLTARPRFDRATLTWQRDPGSSDLARNSALFITAAALTFALLPEGARSGPGPASEAVHQARGGSVLAIDGDRDGDRVLFDHQAHRNSDEIEGCSECHHMGLPGDEATPCAICHADMHRDTDIFGHDDHVAATGGTDGCELCHEHPEQPKRRDTARACRDCHEQMVAADAAIQPHDPAEWRKAAGYEDAMHGLCIECHEEQVASGAVRDEHLAECATCHQAPASPIDPEDPDHLPDLPDEDEGEGEEDDE